MQWLRPVAKALKEPDTRRNAGGHAGEKFSSYHLNRQAVKGCLPAVPAAREAEVERAQEKLARS
jgi:hypothetical protein